MKTFSFVTPVKNFNFPAKKPPKIRMRQFFFFFETK